MTRNTAKGTRLRALIPCWASGVEQYIRKDRSRWNPKTKTHFDAPAMVSRAADLKPAKKPVA